MPKAHTSRINDAQRQRLTISKKSDRYPPSTVYLQVLGSGATGAPNTLYLFTDQKRYLFNCGECTQRLAHEHKVKLSRLNHIFITSKSWRNIGGLPGLSLTLQDVGVPNITLHGPQGLDELYKATKRFVIMKEMNVTMAKCTASEDFEDNTMTVKYVFLYRNFMAMFGPNTQHLVLNSQNACLGSEAVHRTQHKLHLLDGDIFPMLRDASVPAIALAQFQKIIAIEGSKEDGQAAKEEKGAKLEIALAQFQKIIAIEGSKEDGQAAKEEKGAKLEVIAGRTLTMFHLRPKIHLDRSAEPKLHIQDYIQETMDVDGFVDSLESFRRLTDDVRYSKSDSHKEYPKVVFLGTGSCIPSKTRNTSGIALLIEAHRSAAGAPRRVRVGRPAARARIPARARTDLHVALHDEGMTAAVLACIGARRVQTCLVSHCPNAFGVAIQVDGDHKLTYSGDTIPCPALVAIGENSTLLIHEATMEDELAQEARTKMHSTTSQAIDIGRQMNARYTLLTHFSQR
ncbi:Ribonuclease Z-like protein [Operophtera brumata]|uniref:ribonuclease Z n=1 Tax=Operophtera brumata TaxID=104452 RepID=A0A0L7LI14_OPEBR|nr:Ribonuclease Z-like protein [Operophtera brumata]